MIERGLVCLSLAGAAASALAVDIDYWFDVSAGGAVVGYPQPEGLPEAQQPPAWGVDQTLSGRANLAWYPGPNSEVALQYGLEERWRVAQDDGDTTLADQLQGGGGDFRWRDLDPTLAEADDELTLYQNLDRLYGLFYTPAGDITLGRQAISFGLAKVFSPVDVVLPTGVRAQERRYRPGVDAVRWRLPVGAVGEVDAGWVFGEDELVFARTYQQLGAVTTELTALSANGDHHLIGLGTQTALGEWGLWQELAWLSDDASSDVRWTAGVDQQVFEDIYVVAEYHYNGRGEADTPYQAFATDGFYQLGMVVPWARHYLSVQASTPLQPLVQGQVGTTVNLDDGSALATANLDWSLSNNASLGVAAQWPVAAEPDIDGTVPSIKEEFGVYPSQISVNWSTVF